MSTQADLRDAEKPHVAAGGREPTLEGAFAADGVDLTVIHWMLGLSPTERLEAVQQLVDAAWALRERREA